MDTCPKKYAPQFDRPEGHRGEVSSTWLAMWG